MTRSRGLRPRRRYWTSVEDALLRAAYPDVITSTLSDWLMRSKISCHARARLLGLSKSEAFLNSEQSRRLNPLSKVGVPYRFSKGHVPANKGLRRPGWAAGRMRETQFKKGRPAQEARNYVSIGTEKFDRKRKVIVRKITDDPAIVPVMRWRPVHVLVWEATNGPIPPGHICIFKPGMKTFDTSLITIDRLEVVTLAENMKRNTIHNLPPPLKQVIQLRGALRRQTNKRDRTNEQQS